MPVTDSNKDRPSRKEGKAAPAQEHPRKGVFWDKAAGQWATRIGYRLADDGRRVREPVQRLGADADDATVQHIKLQREWDSLEEHWAELSVAIRPGLPEQIRDVADLSKPVWIKKEWAEAAQVNGRAAVDDIKLGMLQLVVDKAAAAADQIDTAKDFLSRFQDRPGQPSVLGMLPDELKARVLQALQPAANQVRGVAPDAKPMTLREAKEAFIAYKRAKIGLNLKGRRGGIKGATLNTIGADLDFSHTVNKDAVTIDGTTYDKGTLKLSPITAQKITETVNTDGVSQQFTYYRRTYTIKARRDGWRDKPLDVGMNELIPDPTDPNKPGKLRPIVSSAGTPVTKPWPLSKGKRKPKATDKPDVLDFQPYDEVSWDDLKPFQASTWPPVVTL